MFDMHCHVDLIDPMDKFCAEAQLQDISILAMTTTPRAYDAELRLLSKFPSVFIALGLHPQLVADRKDELTIFERMVSSSKFIGEIGLDFSKRFYHSKADQISVFEHIIESCDHSKTISIHSVFSDRQVLDILERHRATVRNNCILHWYSGSLKQLDRALELGCYFSINEQMLSSPNGTKIIEQIPASRILLESDAPFVGEVRTPASLKSALKRVTTKLSQIKQMDIMEETNRTSCNILGI